MGILNETFQNIANSIRGTGVTQDTMTPIQMAGLISECESKTTFSNFLEGHTSAYFERNDISYLRPYAFAGDTEVTAVSMTKCAIVGDYAFYGCTSLTSASLGIEQEYRLF